MGVFAKLFSKKKEMRIVMLGLDNAGKTTILYKLKLGDVISTIPTVGFNVETLQYRKIEFTVWDIGGQDRIRCLWRHYFKNAQGIIFVIDSNDRERMEECALELGKLMKEGDLKEAKLLVFANKQDMPNALTLSEISNKLNLSSLKNKWFIQSSCAKSGDGLYEGLDWLSNALDA
eukprot:TRINITY_DN10562_c0_g1_i1.p1 TRINITY_DN10562_c0_g1~~TRINITY_DN10562_c0_g1_i1.p1  ORF type:complete len:175 (+),score=50.05 TRINITY_DN10562_c0_g1_i1:280-804(+)